MANEILFKKGSYSDFKTKVLANDQAINGALYLTEDEGGLYLGLSTGKVQRIQGSVIFYADVFEFQNNVQPPYSHDVIYFISNSNALIRWDAEASNADGSKGKWVQLNATQADVTASLTSLQNQITNEITARQNADSAHDTAIGKRLETSVFETYKTTNDAAVAAAKQQADKGVADAGKAQSAATSAQNAADAAQRRADEAYELADAAVTPGELANKNYATKNEAQGYANAVLGTSDDASTANTVYGAKKAAAEASSAATGAQNTANSAVTAASTAQNTADQAVRDAAAANQNANTRVLTSDFTAFQATNTTKIAEAKKAGTDAQSTANSALNTANGALQRSGGIMTGDITMSNNKTIKDVPNPTANTDVANKAYVDSAESNAKAYADSILAANDAMTFRGVVNASTDLPTTGVQKGDTYKVGTKGTYATNIAAKVGDLLINNGEDNGTPNWVHVSSGYEDDYLQKLVTDNGTIYLTDGVNSTSNYQGGFKFAAAANTNLSFAVSSSNNVHTVTATMTWGSF